MQSAFINSLIISDFCFELKPFKMIIAKKGKLTKPFSQLSWDNLGENKNGWVEVTGGTTENIATKKVAPPTGDKAPAIGDLKTENILGKKDEVITNDLSKVNNSSDPSIEAFIAEQKAAFVEVAKANLNKGLIKDYLDSLEEPVKYKANDNFETLIDLLHENLAGDIELLKSKFSINENQA